MLICGGGPRLFGVAGLRIQAVRGTDATAADVNEVEIELQPFGWQRDGQQKTLINLHSAPAECRLIMPGLRFNYRFAERWEVVADGQFERPLSPSGRSRFAATDSRAGGWPLPANGHAKGL
jgi:hypothetical protein